MLIQDLIAELATEAIRRAQAAGALPAFEAPAVAVQPPRRPEFGDMSTSVCMQMARLARMAPLRIAEIVVAHHPAHDMIGNVEVAPPGFLNYTFSSGWLARQVETINACAERWGWIDAGQGSRVQVEYGSANPTGPLHVGFGRNVVLGDAIANVLAAAGYDVEREYYINDAGTQVYMLGASMYARYMALLGHDVALPEDGYRGAYVIEWAQQVVDAEGARYAEMPRAKAQPILRDIAREEALRGIRRDCERLGVHYDSWFSEQSLYDSGLFDRILDMLRAGGYVAEREGAVWFASPDLEEDAVLIRSPQVIADPARRPTYLASDLAYAWNKLVDRGFDRAIYVWGADHHGDVPRVKAGLKAIGLDPERAELIIYQMVSVKASGEDVRMSKRAGEFVALSELLDDVGADATRFFLLLRSSDSQMDFDVDLAKTQSEENPVYYVQYAHARIASLFRIAQERGWTDWSDGDVALLVHPKELDLIRKMIQLPEVVARAADELAPHHLCYYAQELASALHSFYRECRVVSSDPADVGITLARLKLVQAAQHALANTLRLIGVAAPEEM
ncbi:MAG: arginine--tRNA ligase [Anaerolineae bacterium]|nr:arginine--tRNA ligase [Anaerolineae bacterium]